MPKVTDNQWILDYLETVRKADFFGDITFQVRSGEIYLIREQRTIKPPENPGGKGYRTI